MSRESARLWGLSLESWIALAALVPVPAWFCAHVALDPGPAWRATYFSRPDFSGLVEHTEERQLSHYWDAQRSSAPGGFDARSSSARYDTCIELDAARELPVMLVANGVARLLVDGLEELSGADAKKRWLRSKTLVLPAGVHHLHVEFSARNWPSIGLLASLDGHAPTALGSGRVSPGVFTRLPLGVSPAPCALP